MNLHRVSKNVRSLLLPLHIFLIAGHLILGQVLALLGNNLLKLDGRVSLLGALENGPGSAIGKVCNTVPITLHCNSKSRSTTVGLPVDAAFRVWQRGPDLAVKDCICHPSFPQ